MNDLETVSHFPLADCNVDKFWKLLDNLEPQIACTIQVIVAQFSIINLILHKTCCFHLTSMSVFLALHIFDWRSF